LESGKRNVDYIKSETLTEELVLKIYHDGTEIEFDEYKKIVITNK
jgi:hypothetical protein